MLKDIQQIITLTSEYKKVLIIVLVLGICLGVGVGIVFKSTFKDSAKQITCLDQNPDLQVTVEISGAVKDPGVYTLDTSSRVGDLLAMSGGYLREAAKTWISKNINLSTKLSDAQKVYIPFEWDIYDPENVSLEVYKGVVVENYDTTSSPGSIEIMEGNPISLGSSKVNVNVAVLSELDELPGVGPAYAQKIIDNRPFSGYEDFAERAGLKSNTLDGIKEMVSF